MGNSNRKNMDLKGKTILIAGGTGLIGNHLSDYLGGLDADIRLLSRKRGEYNGIKAFGWSPSEHKMDMEALEGVDYIINLAGAGVADGRWTTKRKKLIVDSRIDSAATFEKALEARGERPKAYIAASAVGIYGDRGDEVLTEESAPGSGFLAETTLKWEAASDRMKKFMPVKKLRIGLVLSTKGGALPSMAGPQRTGIGALLGGGRQFYPWVHIRDIARMFQFLIEKDDLEGVFNGVGPGPVRQSDMVDAIRKGMKRPAIKLPAPSFVLKTMLGEMAEVVLSSNRVVPERLEKEGFEFQFSDIVEALRDLVENKY